MMVIEKGDFFVITRGINSCKSNFLFTRQEESWKEPQDEEDRYDRSYHNKVFFAAEVCGQLVAATLIHGGTTWIHENQTISLNISEIEVMTVSKTYVAALKTERS